MLKELPRGRAGGLPSEAGLFEVDHWRRTLAAASRPAEPDSSPILLPVIELLARGVAAAQNAGASFSLQNAVFDDYKTPYLYQYSLEVQRLIAKNLVASVAYVGSRGRQNHLRGEETRWRVVA